MSIQALIAQQEKTITEAQATIDLLNRLPAGLDVDLVFYSNGWHLKLGSGLQKALQLLVPLAIDIRRDNWGNPTDVALDRQAADGDICFPIAVAHDKGAYRGEASSYRWVTRLDDGTELQVQAVASEPLTIPVGYSMVHGVYKSYYRRNMVFPKAAAVDVTDKEQSYSVEAAKALEQLFETKLAKVRNPVQGDVLTQMLSAALGYDVHVSVRGKALLYGTDVIKYSFWVKVGRFLEGVEIKLPATFDPAGFDFDYPEGATYADAGPLLQPAADDNA